MQLPDLSLLLIVVIFWGVYWILRVFLFRPLGTILEEREAKAAGAEKALESAIERRTGTLADVENRLTAARRDAMATRETVRQQVGQRRQELLDATRGRSRTESVEALARLEREAEAARTELARGAAAVAAEIATLALGRKVA